MSLDIAVMTMRVLGVVAVLSLLVCAPLTFAAASSQSFSVDVAGTGTGNVPAVAVITAIVTSDDGNSSEFSSCLPSTVLAHSVFANRFE